MKFLTVVIVILVAVQLIPELQTTVTSLVGSGGELYGTSAGTILGFVVLGLAVTILILAFSGAAGDNA